MDDDKKNDKLKGFLDPKCPHLIRFRDVAPGSFRHCENVSVFCESIAIELELDVDLMKVAAKYHDIGKINYPEAFSENQNGENIHDKLDPMISYQLITRHVGDGVVYLLEMEDMPREVMEIISQHHGNTVLKFFYKKSKGKVDDLYRYRCCMPKRIESAILMICDSVEATSRALAVNGELENMEDRRKVVDSTIMRLTNDDQLDNMKVGELKVVRKVLYKELESIYHKRELYGDEKEIDVE